MSIAIFCEENSVQTYAIQLSQQFNWPIVYSKDTTHDVLLICKPTEIYLELIKTNERLSIDFLTGKNAYRIVHSLKKDELLLKAIGLKLGTPLTIIDATAGLGRDSLLMASFGCDVLMLERSPILYILLQHALAKLHKQQPGLLLNLQFTNAQDYLQQLPEEKRPQIIYLDPMYPERKKSALVKKEMRILREVVGADMDIEQLFAIAMGKALSRVVIKRPKLADFVANQKPDIQYHGKAARFDVYIHRAMRTKLS